MHRSRGGLSAAKQAAPTQIRQSSGSRAAQAAARVAARYAQAPSYSQMMAAEAPAVWLPAETVPQASVREKAVSEPVAEVVAASVHSGPRLLEPEAPRAVAATPARDWEPGPTLAQLAAPASLEDWESEYSHTRREPDLRLRPLELVSAPAALPMPRQDEGLASSAEDGKEKPRLAPALVEKLWEMEELEPVEPVLPIHANLIEFPRELVATRKMRPRRAEGRFAMEGVKKQLSIFEVDPGAISTEPEAIDAGSVPAWQESDWSGIELEAESRSEAEPEEAPVPQLAPELAPIGRRMIGALVDGAPIAGVALGSALAVAATFGHLRATRLVELGAASALLLVGMIYHTLFLTLAGATPGMRCVRISLCTFDGQIPTGAQIRSRLGALFLSIVPVGLGIAWALFDDDHLCWHDRLSRTYLRRG